MRKREGEIGNYVHLPYTLVHVHAALYLFNLVDSQLKDTTFPFLRSSLLHRKIKGPLGLNSGLLDLNQNLDAPLSWSG